MKYRGLFKLSSKLFNEIYPEGKPDNINEDTNLKESNDSFWKDSNNFF